MPGANRWPLYILRTTYILHTWGSAGLLTNPSVSPHRPASMHPTMRLTFLFAVDHLLVEFRLSLAMVGHPR